MDSSASASSSWPSNTHRGDDILFIIWLLVSALFSSLSPSVWANTTQPTSQATTRPAPPKSAPPSLTTKSPSRTQPEKKRANTPQAPQRGAVTKVPQRGAVAKAPQASPTPPQVTDKGQRRGKGPKPFPKLPSLINDSFVWKQMIGMLFALGIVVLLIFVVFRWAAQRMGVAPNTYQRLLKSRDRLMLEPKKSLWVIEAAGDYFLIATHEQGVTLLQQLDAEAIEGEQPASPEEGGFWGRLMRGPTDPPSKEDERPSEPGHTSDAIPTEFEVVSDGTQEKAER